MMASGGMLYFPAVSCRIGDEVLSKVEVVPLVVLVLNLSICLIWSTMIAPADDFSGAVQVLLVVRTS